MLTIYLTIILSYYLSIILPIFPIIYLFKDLEKLDQDKKALFMSGVAPKMISGKLFYIYYIRGVYCKY